jgi:dethiobiotin synthetase
VNGLFVTGTDTGVGKTFVTCALAGRLRSRGWRVAAVKPAESGCAEGPHGLIAADADAIASAAGDWQSSSERCLYRMGEAVAPGVAAGREGVTVSVEACAAFARSVAANAEVVLMEGAGGWRVPLDAHGGTIADLAKRVGLPVLVVARATLGTINHAVLTAEAISRDGCTLAAIALSMRPDEDRGMAQSNAEEITRMLGGAHVMIVQAPSDVDPLLDRFTWNERAR